MKKAKKISVLLIILLVIALGVIMGEYVSRFLEESTYVATPYDQKDSTNSTIQILYKTEGESDESMIVSSVPKPLVLASEKSSISDSDSDSDSNTDADASNSPLTTSASATETATNQPLVFSASGPAWHAYASQNGTINIRSGPGTTYASLFRISKGTRGKVLEKKDGWTKIKWDFNKKDGWARDDLILQGPATVLSSMIQKEGGLDKVDVSRIPQEAIKQVLKESKIAIATAIAAPPEQTVESAFDSDNLPSTALIKADPVANIRSAPGTQHEIVGRLPKDMSVKIDQVQQLERWKWFKIIYGDNKKSGWTREDNLRF